MNSLCWRLTHCVLYLFGGICFLAGSVLYYPYYNTGYSNSFDGFTVGAWIYTIGSLTFLISDVQEWWSLRHGCLGPCKPQSVSSVPLRATSAAVVDHEQQQQQQLEEEEEEELLCCSKPAVGINFFSSAFGSLLYLIGSIGFIPNLGILTIGIIGFLAGSIINCIGQAWKLHRLGTYDGSGPERHVTEFRVTNWKVEGCSAFLVDSLAGLGSLMFLVGASIYLYHPELVWVVTVWVAGSACFLLSGFALVYRHMLLGL
eukprot:TRINITY_DN7229_c0_g1_i1.p1 TRINITY_DN7229_c0_g1~~TRINITY_DN7229_c0_g1_i1.p1  ORF type:complete len:258 (+),score=37.04 TRINITY_DN7229_c0_g1_i1:43-816(+)